MKALPFTALVICAGIHAPAQTTTTQRDPQALALLTQSLTAMLKNRPIQDMMVGAQVTRIAGSSEDSGSATLEAAAYDKTNASLAFTSGTQREIRNGGAGDWSGPDGQNHAIALHNTWTTGAWFAPALVIQSWIQDSSFSLAYVGQEQHDGNAVQHVRASRSVSGDVQIAALSATDLYLDVKTLLPTALAFNTHPDNDLGVNLAVQVTYAGYQTFGGLVAPARIQQFLQGSLFLDLSVTATKANNGFGPGDFQLP